MDIPPIRDTPVGKNSLIMNNPDLKLRKSILTKKRCNYTTQMNKPHIKKLLTVLAQ
jgi:hypothetical protein